MMQTGFLPDFADTGYSMDQIANEALDRGINAGHYRADVLANQEKVAGSSQGCARQVAVITESIRNREPPC